MVSKSRDFSNFQPPVVSPEVTFEEVNKNKSVQNAGICWKSVKVTDNVSSTQGKVDVTKNIIIGNRAPVTEQEKVLESPRKFTNAPIANDPLNKFIENSLFQDIEVTASDKLSNTGLVSEEESGSLEKDPQVVIERDLIAFRQEFEVYGKVSRDKEWSAELAGKITELEELSKSDNPDDQGKAKQLSLLIKQQLVTKKTDLLAQGKIREWQGHTYGEIDRGKAKIVLLKVGDPRHVYYVPVKHIFNKKRDEIQKEARKTEVIKKKLFRAKLSEFLGDQKDLAVSLLEKYKNINKAINTISAKPADLLVKDLGISLDDAIKLKEKFTNQSSELEKLKKSGSTLALDLSQLDKAEELGEYTVKTKAAEGNLEKEIQQNKLSQLEKLSLCLDVLSSLRDLHLSGHAHGDLKPDNFLIEIDPVTKRKRARLSDFGKTQLINENETKLYSGNSGFAPPEGKLSQKSEVYSAALIMIRILEEGLIENGKSSLVPLSPEKSVSTPIRESRRGAELYVVQNKFTFQKESSLIGRLTSWGMARSPKFLKKESNTSAEREMIVYIDALVEKMGGNEELRNLLVSMTKSDPKDRISMDKAFEEFQRINPAIIG